ncbi:MAG: hypothetical protein AB1805_05870 [Nitrospirota bacterium]
MDIREFKSELISRIKELFPEAPVTAAEKRGTIIEVRADLSEKIFLEIYYNVLTGKKSYALINQNERVYGCDNYRFWHIHPEHDPSQHIPCTEPSIKDVCSKMKQVYATVIAPE